MFRESARVRERGREHARAKKKERTNSQVKQPLGVGGGGLLPRHGKESERRRRQEARCPQGSRTWIPPLHFYCCLCACVCMYVCVYVCVCVRMRAQEPQPLFLSLCLSVCLSLSLSLSLYLSLSLTRRSSFLPCHCPSSPSRLLRVAPPRCGKGLGTRLALGARCAAMRQPWMPLSAWCVT